MPLIFYCFVYRHISKIKKADSNHFFEQPLLTFQKSFGIMKIAEDDGYTFLQMRSMYCFVEYKMLLFNPTLQETIGNDIIYIISKPPEDSAHGLYCFETEL